MEWAVNKAAGYRRKTTSSGIFYAEALAPATDRGQRSAAGQPADAGVAGLILTRIIGDRPVVSAHPMHPSQAWPEGSLHVECPR